jgi:rare lipoprotein A
MKQWLALFAVSLVLTACGGNKEYGDAPGFRNGKATHPLVKLGKPYEIGGETYYPEYDPEYVETGMASWYGPGFHGKSTANGERFNTGDMTAAHRTLPLPSIVKVTNVTNGKSVIVRVNDRGPFTHSRILDVSQRAAQQLDMVRSGTAKVKVEYMPEASRRYVALLEEGRSPSNINVARDVLIGETSFAQASQAYDTEKQKEERSWFDRINPVSSAHAEEPKAPKGGVISVQTTTTKELPPLENEPPPPATLPPPEHPVIGTTNVTARSPFDVLPKKEKIEDPKMEVPKAVIGRYVVQLGVFGNEANALNLRQKFADVADIDITKLNVDGRQLYRVRLGPFADEIAAKEIEARAHSLGVPDAKIIKL